MPNKKLLVFVFLVLFGCQQQKQEWNPIMEETDFDFFTTNIERSLALIDEAYAEASTNHLESVQEKINQAKHRLLEIKDYYIPFTTVRQKIYDADRYFKLSNIDKAQILLKDSKSILSSLDMTTQNKNFDKFILELNSKIDEVLSSFDDDSKSATYLKMKKLGEHINLMLIRGDLVLSGIEFDK